MRALLGKLDDFVYRLEKWTCVLLIQAMTLAVFLSVVYRRASTEGRLDQLLRSALPEAAVSAMSALVVAAISFGLIYLALRTARVASKPSPRRAALWSLGGVAVGWMTIRLMLAFSDGGFVWSQSFALSAMLWIGFLGASMASKEGSHLALEITEVIWRGRLKGWVGRAGSLAAFGFCALMTYLAWLKVRYHHQTWLESDGVSGVFEGFPVPMFVVYAILPFSFGVMALRFLGRAVGPEREEAGPRIKPIQMDSAEGSAG